MNYSPSRINNFGSPVCQRALQLNDSLHIFLLSNLFVDMSGDRFDLFSGCIENPPLFISICLSDQLRDQEKVTRYPLNGYDEQRFQLSGNGRKSFLLTNECLKLFVILAQILLDGKLMKSWH